jgi:hypothetical protein
MLDHATGSGPGRWKDFDVVDCRALRPIGNTLDTDVVAGAKGQPKDSPSRGRIAAGLRRRQMIIGGPFVDNPFVNEYAKLRFAVVLVKIFNIHLVLAGSAIEAKRCGTLLRRRGALDRLSTRSGFTWNNLERHISLQLHCFGLNAVGIVTYPAEFVGYAGNLQKPIANGIPPNDSVSGLKFESVQHFRITVLVYATFQRFPLLD